ncbi:HupE/UreJ family protein [Pararhizobium sp. YC-54]|uniref:HupE/UreJ family protein n=1 Tax=Pararhizobium sp. YC-54 TaxID=2986920 RepID=UPI0021F7D966|nr:HupE/UreJ family protein [Pararhizobium sp. YC-54]MCW0002007.1 HupE/UreJ family protein [Pararhizobium sp. YC-54]
MIRLVVFVLACLFAIPAQAHELRPAFLQIDEVAPEQYAVTWKVPARGELRMALYVHFPATCRQVSEPVEGYIDTAHVSRWRVSCDGGLTNQTVSIDGLTSTYTDALARIVNLDGTIQTSRISPKSPKMVVAERPTALATAGTYFSLGVEHILLGFDHLLFVLALLLLIRDLRSLLLTITAFTAAHSVTLAFSALGIAAAPQPPVEALIALSIMFVASEIIRGSQGNLSGRYPWLVSFLFGLLHGFGFGGALREIGLPQKDVPLALLTFNLGVEAGQLVFVGVTLLAVACIRLRPVVNVARVRLLLAYFIGTVSAFWFVQRLAGFA